MPLRTVDPSPYALALCLWSPPRPSSRGQPSRPPCPGPSQGSASGCAPWVRTPSSAMFTQVCVLRGPHPLGNPHRPPGCGSCPVNSLCPHHGPRPPAAPSPSLSHGQFKLNFPLTDTFSVGHRGLQVSSGTSWTPPRARRVGDRMLRAAKPRGGQLQPAASVPLAPNRRGAPAPPADGAAVPWSSGRPAPTTTARQAGARLLGSANEDRTR